MSFYKMKNYLYLLLFFTVVFSANNTVFADRLADHRENVPQDKIWTISFNSAVDPDTVTSENIFLLDSRDNRLEQIAVSVNENSGQEVIVENLVDYHFGKTYHLFITDGLTSHSGTPIRQDIEMSFTIKNEIEHIGAVGPTTLHVLFSGKDEYEVIELEESLTNNIEKEVTFEILGQTFVETVLFELEPEIDDSLNPVDENNEEGRNGLIREIDLGMSKEHVKKHEKAFLVEETNDALLYVDAQVYGLPGNLIYEFANDELNTIVFLVEDVAKLSVSDSETLFLYLLHSLENDFGEADHLDDDWFNDEVDYVLEALWDIGGDLEINMVVLIEENFPYDTYSGVIFRAY